MGLNNTALAANKPQLMLRSLEGDAAFQGLLFNMTTDAVLASASRFDTFTALTKREFIEFAVKANFSLIEMLISPVGLSFRAHGSRLIGQEF